MKRTKPMFSSSKRTRNSSQGAKKEDRPCFLRKCPSISTKSKPTSNADLIIKKWLINMAARSKLSGTSSTIKMIHSTPKNQGRMEQFPKPLWHRLPSNPKPISARAWTSNISCGMKISLKICEKNKPHPDHLFFIQSSTHLIKNFYTIFNF